MAAMPIMVVVLTMPHVPAMSRGLAGPSLVFPDVFDRVTGRVNFWGMWVVVLHAHILISDTPYGYLLQKQEPRFLALCMTLAHRDPCDRCYAAA